MSEYKPIQCELHDGYELACMRKLIAEVICVMIAVIYIGRNYAIWILRSSAAKNFSSQIIVKGSNADSG